VCLSTGIPGEGLINRVSPFIAQFSGFVSTRLIVFLSLSLALGACVNFKANYLAPLYGEFANDNVNVRPDGQPISMPPNAPSISQGFYPAPDEREPKDYPQDHAGIDIVAKRGTPVLAAASGTVKSAFYEPLFGHQITITHEQDYEQSPMKSNYLHLRHKLVSAGEKVEAGQQIGELGSSGFFAAFPHLHFEIRQHQGKPGWVPLNPHLFWQHGIGIVTCFPATPTSNTGQFNITYPVQCRSQ
jgi:murein DD-endopeptidase MepM/ murein hydrolase activator NlpD